MQKIGDITPTANAEGEYREGSAEAGVGPTLIKAGWLNTVQRELLNVVLGAGFAINPADDSQVFKAIKAIQESRIQEAIAALVASSPAALDTLNELAQALGNDPDFATTMTTALSDKANKATTLSGYGITDANTKTETAAAIKAATTMAITNVTTSKTLMAAELGLVLIDGSAAAVTVELPDSNAALGVRGVVLRRTDNTGNRMVIKTAGSNKIKFHTHLRAEGYPFFVLMGAGDYWHLHSDGAGGWIPIARFDSTPLGRPVFETTTAFSPGGWAGLNGWLYSRAEWPWVWDHAQASGMLATEAQRAGNEGCWTSGDGASTFRSPEGRGEFFRIHDETRGVDVGRLPGSSKLSQNKVHEHAARTYLGLSGTSGSNGLVAYTNTAVGSQLATGAVSLEGGSEAYPRHIAFPGRLKMI
jgi:hypothetical protein